MTTPAYGALACMLVLHSNSNKFDSCWALQKCGLAPDFDFFFFFFNVFIKWVKEFFQVIQITKNNLSSFGCHISKYNSKIIKLFFFIGSENNGFQIFYYFSLK